MKNKSLKQGIISILAATKGYFRIIKNSNKKVLASIVAVVMMLTAFGVITEYYTLAYNVYYGDVSVGFAATKDEAMECYSEAETDVENISGNSLEHSLTFVMTVAPVAKMLESNIYRGIIEAAEGKAECYNIMVGDEVITTVATLEDAKNAIDMYLASFEQKNASIHSEYTIHQANEIITHIKTLDEAVEDIKASGKMVVTYDEVLEENVEISYKEIYVEDSQIPQGMTKCYREGENGHGTRTMTCYENGHGKQIHHPTVEVSEECVDKIIHVGTGEELKGIEKKSLPWPTEGNYTSPYGHRWGRMHTGIDIAAKTGTPIYAPCTGVVTFAGDKSSWGYGKYVVIDHGEGYETTYAHMSQICVKEGEVVKKGDLIGKVGATGRVTGEHLHFEILHDGCHVDPSDYIAVDKKLEK